MSKKRKAMPKRVTLGTFFEAYAREVKRQFDEWRMKKYAVDVPKEDYEVKAEN